MIHCPESIQVFLFFCFFHISYSSVTWLQPCTLVIKKKKIFKRVLIYNPDPVIYKICMVFSNYFFNEAFSQLVVTNNIHKECCVRLCVKGFAYVDPFSLRSGMTWAELLFLWVLFKMFNTQQGMRRPVGTDSPPMRTDAIPVHTY